jgi:hypothetical protein
MAYCHYPASLAIYFCIRDCFSATTSRNLWFGLLRAVWPYVPSHLYSFLACLPYEYEISFRMVTMMVKVTGRTL